MKINNIFSITRDNASNNNTLLDFFKKSYYSLTNKEFIIDIRCAAHILNLVARDILRDYLRSSSNSTTTTTIDSTITSRIRRLASILKYNHEPKKLFTEGIHKYKTKGIIPLNYNIIHIPLDNTTRWNSTYYIIKTTLELKEPILYVLRNTENDEFQQLILNNTEWEILHELSLIFEVFVKPTTKLQGQIYTTLNHTLLYIYKIYSKLHSLMKTYKAKAQALRTNNNNNNNYYNSFISAIKAGIEKLDKYFPQHLSSHSIKNYRPYFISIALDPRLKLIHFEEKGLLYFYPGIKDDILALFKSEYNKVKAEVNRHKTAQPTTQFNASFDELNEDIYNASSQDNSSDSDDFYIKDNSQIKDESTAYFNESTISSKIHPLDYWKHNIYKYPILNIIARRYLAIPATSASIESTFSIGSNIITKSRNRLSSTTAKQLILLKSWKIKDLKELEKEREVEEEEDIEE